MSNLAQALRPKRNSCCMPCRSMHVLDLLGRCCCIRINEKKRIKKTAYKVAVQKSSIPEDLAEAASQGIERKGRLSEQHFVKDFDEATKILSLSNYLKK